MRGGCGRLHKVVPLSKLVWFQSKSSRQWHRISIIEFLTVMRWGGGRLHKVNWIGFSQKALGKTQKLSPIHGEIQSLQIVGYLFRNNNSK
jgi:hypothetical protein